MIKRIGYNHGSMSRFIHTQNPLTPGEWERLLKTIRTVGNSTVSRRILSTTQPLGAGIQTVPLESQIGLTEGYKVFSDRDSSPVRTNFRGSGIIPIISKDFVLYWRDLAESRLTGQIIPIAKAAAAASVCARSEDKFIFFGHTPLGYDGLMTVKGRNIITGLRWSFPGDAFYNFTQIAQVLVSKGHDGPYAAVVHPQIYANMHSVLKNSSLLEITHVKSLLTAGIFKSSLLAPRSGVVISANRQNLEMVISIDTTAAFLGAKKMNLPFRVFKAICLRILRSDAICTF